MQANLFGEQKRHCVQVSKGLGVHRAETFTGQMSKTELDIISVGLCE